MFKVNNRSTRCCSGVFIVHFEYILLEYILPVVIVFFADFEHVNGRCSTLLPLSKFINAFQNWI